VNAIQAIRSSLQTSHMALSMYLSDMNDSDLFIRPVPNANHAAWQLGHVIKSEHDIVEMVRPGSCPPLPDGFADSYTKDTAKLDDPSKFHTKAQYLEIFNNQRKATLQLLESLSEADLDAPGPAAFRRFFPTVGALLSMIANHESMHSGQIVVLRRLRGKPILI